MIDYQIKKTNGYLLKKTQRNFEIQRTEFEAQITQASMTQNVAISLANIKKHFNCVQYQCKHIKANPNVNALSVIK